MQTNGILHFGVTEFNFIMLIWMLIATGAFVYLNLPMNAAIAEEGKLSTDQSPTKLPQIDEPNSSNVTEFSPFSVGFLFSSIFILLRWIIISILLHFLLIVKLNTELDY